MRWSNRGLTEGTALNQISLSFFEKGKRGTMFIVENIAKKTLLFTKTSLIIPVKERISLALFLLLM